MSTRINRDKKNFLPYNIIGAPKKFFKNDPLPYLAIRVIKSQIHLVRQSL